MKGKGKMLFAAFKIGMSALIIAFSAWLSGKRPELAGFIVALPLVTLLTLAFSHLEYKDTENTILFAKSVFAAIPLTLLFFVPFLLAEKIPFGFWGIYATGLVLLACGYFAHRWIMTVL